MSLKITFIGAGSLVFARTLFTDIMSVPELQRAEISFTDINPDKDLFYFFIEIIIDTGKAAENRVNSGHDIISRFCQTLPETSEKTFLFL